MLPDTVNVFTVPTILKLVEASPQSFTVVDFVKVKQADSVALAMLLKWQTVSGKPIQIRNLPDVLATLIHLYDLEDVLQA